MKILKSKIIRITLLALIFILPFFTEQNINFNIANRMVDSSSADPDDVILNAIYMEQIRGSSEVKYKITGTLRKAGDDVTPGIYTISTKQIDFDDDLVSSPNYHALHMMCDGYYDGVSDAISEQAYWESCTASPNYANGAAYDDITFTLKCQDYRYLAPSIWGADYMEYDEGIATYISWSIYNAGNSFHLDEDPIAHHIDLNYHFEPIVSIDSVDYNIHNIRCEVYNFYPFGYTDSGWMWEEQSIYSLTLNAPEYKIRLYDLATDELIYEDTDLVWVSAQRSISILSLKLNNNAGEPVNMSIYSAMRTSYTEIANVSHYELGSISNSSTQQLSSSSVTNHTNDYQHWQGVYNWTAVTSSRYPTGGPFAHDYGANDIVGSIVSENGHTHAWKFYSPTAEAWHIDFTHSDIYYSQIWVQFETTNNKWDFAVLDTSAAFTLVTFQIDGTADIDVGGVNTNVGSYSANTWYKLTHYINRNGACNISVQGGGIDVSYTWTNTRNIQIHMMVGWSYNDAAAETSAYFDALGVSTASPSYILNTNNELTNTYNLINSSYSVRFSGVSTPYNNLTISSTIQNWTTPIIYLYNYYLAANETFTGNKTELNYTSLYVSNECITLGIYAVNTTSSFTINITTSATITYFTYIMEGYVNITYYSPANFSIIVNPYSYSLTNITAALYNFSYIYVLDLYGNLLDNFTSANDSTIDYTPPNVRTCLISLADQRNNYLNFQNYKVYLNGSIIYEQYFYREIGEIVNITIYDRFGIYLTGQQYTVERDDNFIGIQLNLYKLKICNYHEVFHHVNVTRDPNFYSTTQFWSEYIAPHEIIDFDLPTGYWRVNVTWNNGTNIIYSYTLAGDDVLFLDSSNTLANVITNIANVNTTIGNQITNVEINLTNQNSNINNTILNIDITLSNVNSTMGNLLLAQNTTLNNIGNNITTMFLYQQNAFTTLGSNINTSFVELNTSVYLVNNSIYTAVNSLGASLTNINNSVSGNLTLILSMNEYLTQVYQYCMFSDFLDWSNASYDDDYITNQIETYQFVNNYRNQSVELELLYQNQTETLLLGSQALVTQVLPNSDVEYRIKSLSTGEYLSEWVDLTNKTVDLGFYEEVIPATPGDVRTEINDWILAIALIAIIAGVASVVAIKWKKELNQYKPGKKSRRNRRLIPGVVDNSDILR